ncbi:hypothetical protein D3C80_619210 [compost metagenome]
MAAQVLLGQAHHLLATQHVYIDLRHIQRGALGGAEQGVGSGVHGRLLAAHLVLGRETVEHHLLQTQAGFAAVQGLPMIVAGGPGSGVVCAFTAVPGQQVHGRQVAPLGGLQLLVGRQTAVYPRLDFRVDVHGPLHGLGEALGLDWKACDQGERKNRGETQTHILGILFVELKARKPRRKPAESASRPPPDPVKQITPKDLKRASKYQSDSMESIV